MAKKSAGLLLFRETEDKSSIEVLLVHPGGPFWRKKDEGAWTIPKGEFGDDEDPLEAAKREFEEETGGMAPGSSSRPTETQDETVCGGNYIPLKPVKQSGGKIVHAWAVKGNFDPGALASNEFQIEWPPRSGRMQSFPEIDRAEWFTFDVAIRKILKGQAPLVRELLRIIESQRRSRY